MIFYPCPCRFIPVMTKCCDIFNYLCLCCKRFILKGRCVCGLTLCLACGLFCHFTADSCILCFFMGCIILADSLCCARFTIFRPSVCGFAPVMAECFYCFLLRIYIGICLTVVFDCCCIGLFSRFSTCRFFCYLTCDSPIKLKIVSFIVVVITLKRCRCFCESFPCPLRLSCVYMAEVNRYFCGLATHCCDDLAKYLYCSLDYCFSVCGIP